MTRSQSVDFARGHCTKHHARSASSTDFDCHVGLYRYRLVADILTPGDPDVDSKVVAELQNRPLTLLGRICTSLPKQLDFRDLCHALTAAHGTKQKLAPKMPSLSFDSMPDELVFYHHAAR